MISGLDLCDSGLLHHAHRMGQPFINTRVRIPGPSCKEKRCMSKTNPLVFRCEFNSGLILFVDKEKESRGQDADSETLA
jgi:hypothetical protein